MKNFYLVLLSLTFLSCAAKAVPSATPKDVPPEALLQAGPMVGYSEMREVMLWVQTTAAAEVKIAYWEQGGENKLFTNTVLTRKETGFTAHLVADELEPGKKYDYQLYINNKAVKLPYACSFQTQSLWQWRTDPPEFSFAIGSCAFVNEKVYDRPGNGYGKGYHIFTSIDRDRPDFMLWLGDNVYLREVDWFTKSGMIKRYTHTRSLPELQPLLAHTHHYAIWDDHDFGPNNSDRSFIHKDKAREVFQLFWANPTYGLDGQRGITSYFQWGDVDFFLLDNRYFRAPNNCRTCNCTILGEEQLNWLIEALSSSHAPFKMVAIGGQVLTTEEHYETYINICPEERTRLLARIAAEGIQNVVFLTGDRHFTELSVYTNESGNAVYDLTVSPLTSGHARYTDQDNALRVDGTAVFERNYAILTLRGPRTERMLHIQVKNTEGALIWEYEIHSQKAE